jgi:hypothetical protein
MVRSPEAVPQEIQDNSAAHIANEIQRDAFVSLGHTALFAASIAFIGDVAKPGEAEFLWILYLAWASSVLGLLSLTASFELAKRQNDKQRDLVHLLALEVSPFADYANRLALWTFPISLICLAFFAGINVAKA